jgi:hypothetical protein
MANKKMRKMAILAKIEPLYGTDSVPTGAANAMVVANVELTPLDGDVIERNNIQPYFGNNGAIQTTFFGKVKFECELAGAGVAGTAPISEALESLTLYGNIDGINHVMPGAVGECKWVLGAKGKPALQFEFTGLFTPLTDTPLPAVVYTGWTKPVAVNKANTTCALFGTAVNMSSFDMSFGNQVTKRDLVGVDSVEIVDRKSAGSIVFENTAIATKDWVSLAKTTTLGSLAIVHGTVPGNIVEVNSGAGCEISKPSYSNVDGVQMMNLQTRFIPSSAGNDEWSIVVR